MEYYSLKFPASVQGTDLVQDQWPRLPIQDVISTQHINGDETESWMATLRHGSCHAVELYKRIGDSSSISSSYRHIWTIPSLGNGIANRPTSICFFDFPACSADRGAGEGSLAKKLCLAVATASSAVYIFDVHQKRLHPWSEERLLSASGKNGFPAPPLPMDAVVNHVNFCCEYPVRLTVNPGAPTKLIVVRADRIDFVPFGLRRVLCKKVISGSTLMTGLVPSFPCRVGLSPLQNEAICRLSIRPASCHNTSRWGWYSNVPHSRLSLRNAN